MRLKRKAKEWSSIPGELVEVIGNKLDAFEDLLALRAVCKSWRSAMSIQLWKPCVQVPRLPWLILPSTAWTTGFYDLEKGKRYDLKLPAASGRWGCPNGWIFNVGFNHLESFLVHIFTGVEIYLPTLNTVIEPEGNDNDYIEPEYYDYLDELYFWDKVIVFEKSKPTHSHGNDCADANIEVVVVAMLIYDYYTRLAVWKSGYTSWVLVEQEKGHSYQDLMCYKGQTLVVCRDGSLHVICDIDGPHRPKAVDLASAPQSLPPNAPEFLPDIDEMYVPHVNDGRERIYLVESGKDLLMVHCRQVYYKPTYFRVHKFNFQTREWEDVYNLGGDCTLFVGRNYSVSIQPRAANLNCEPNCIYFEDSSRMTWHETRLQPRYVTEEAEGLYLMGIFDMKNKTLETHDIGDDSYSCVSPPTWVGLWHGFSLVVYFG